MLFSRVLIKKERRLVHHFPFLKLAIISSLSFAIKLRFCGKVLSESYIISLCYFTENQRPSFNIGKSNLIRIRFIDKLV